ncbi:MAG: hypothetical protein RL722_1534 [Pseudomonadota bacterium]|jgi:hypothetical protein
MDMDQQLAAQHSGEGKAPRRVAVYFVATPLHYLCARLVARHFEPGARQVLLWYLPGAGPVVRAADWDVAAPLPWPRFDPLPGPFGRQRRLVDNLRLVAELAGPCEELVLHAPVYDTEAINYFLHALPRRCGARVMQARILPDGLGSMTAQPLSGRRRLAQRLRLLRRLVAPSLRYTTYAGDRTGADAAFCDRVYVLPGFPHPYPPAKAQPLPPLADPAAQAARREGQPRRALVVGQPLLAHHLIDVAGLAAVTAEIHAWLADQGITEVLYKAHPRDPHHELRGPNDRLLEIDEALESWMAREPLDAVVGVHSTALLMARQIYGAQTAVCGFGWETVTFRSPQARQEALDAFRLAGVTLRS